jgi:hypothetical protein
VWRGRRSFLVPTVGTRRQARRNAPIGGSGLPARSGASMRPWIVAAIAAIVVVMLVDTAGALVVVEIGAV